MDARSGEILHSVNDRTRLHPASLTKMMTLYIAFEAVQNGEISLDTQFTVSRRAAAEVPSRLGLRAGQRIALRHLIRGAALRSGNDAATAIAEGISGSVEAFARRMNRTAAAIGMSQTTFHNAHGLTQNGHLSTARDMAILSRQLYFDYPQYYNLFSRRSKMPAWPRCATPTGASWTAIRRGRDQDRLHPRGGLQPRRLGAAGRTAHHRRRVSAGARPSIATSASSN
jgi:D-alanyl-D-alanine carboxypeptidase